MKKQPPVQAHGFRTDLAHVVRCDICPAVAYSAPISSTRMAPTEGISFAARGWKLYQHPRWGVVQVCARCARKLTAPWKLIASTKEEAKP